MRAELIQQNNILSRNLFEIFEQPGNQPMIWCCPGMIGKSDANARPEFQPFTQRTRADRIVQRAQNSLLLIRERGFRGWLNYGRAAIGKFDAQVSLPVREVYVHVWEK